MKVFTERFDNHFKPYKRKTDRLESKIRQLGLLAGGKPAERICGMVSMPTSDTTILRLVEKEDLTESEDVTAVGVDDWAYKKRDRYGSILVNLDTPEYAAPSIPVINKKVGYYGSIRIFPTFGGDPWILRFKVQ